MLLLVNAEVLVKDTGGNIGDGASLSIFSLFLHG